MSSAADEPFCIRRLGPEDSIGIVDCIRRVYASTYANEDFYDSSRLSDLMKQGSLFSVGAIRTDGRILGHMAMTRTENATVAELGNSAIDPAARGHGLIWKIGAELVSWSMEFGDDGFLDYPTTAHHIMQRQSIKSGSETGLMLGYIPASTDGKLAGHESRRREAATIVYHPYPERRALRTEQHLPTYCSALVRDMAKATGALRDWADPTPPASTSRSRVSTQRFERRGLHRSSVARAGREIRDEIERLDEDSAACRQIDFKMSDPGIEAGVEAALDAGYWFCGWLPGFAGADVFRMQRVDRSLTNLAPLLVNPVARSLSELIPAAH